MKWCQCYEGQRVEGWGCQDPSHTGLRIIHTTSQVSRHRFRRRSRNPLWGRSAGTEEPEWSVAVRYTTSIWSHKRHETWGLVYAKTEGPLQILINLLINKAKAKEKAYTWVSVWWKTIRYIWGIYTPHIHWVAHWLWEAIFEKFSFLLLAVNCRRMASFTRFRT